MTSGTDTGATLARTATGLLADLEIEYGADTSAGPWTLLLAAALHTI